MAGRILTLQRQARELGRLRTGYTDTSGSKPRPVKSATWVVTSHAEHYVRAAAEVWGGTPEKWQPLGNGAAQWRVITEAPTLDAVLPPGDPLSQSYELWSKGGAQRRCDGMTESLSDEPCLCRAQWGEQFHESAPRDAACKVTTRLNVILPEMPDIGAWRVETHSYYSANEMAAAVDVMKGAIGDAAMIPVRLRIEQRTRVAQGKTKQFPVVAVELRGATAGELLAGNTQAVAIGGPERQAIEAGTRDYIAEIAAAGSRADVEKVWRAAKAAGVPNLAEIEDAARERIERARADQQGRPAADAPSADAPAAAGAPSVDDLWMQIVMAWPGDSTAEIETAFAKRYEGLLPDSADVAQLAEFLAAVQAGQVTA